MIASSKTYSVLLISATYAAPENCKKLEALGQHCDLEVVTVSRVTSVQSGIGLQPLAVVPNVAQFHVLPTSGNPSSTTRYVLKGLQKLFRKKSYDLIFVEAEPWALIRWQVWLLKRRFQRKALLGEFTWENMERPWIKQIALDIAYRLAGLTSDFMICGSLGAAALVSRKVPGTRTFVAAQLGVDETLFARVSAERKRELRTQLGIFPETPLIGFCGRFTEAKGVVDLALAIKQLSEKPGMENLKAAFLGRGPLKDTIYKILGTRAIFVPPLPHERVCEFMQMIDALVLPSKTIRTWSQTWQEQFGHVLIEAMACGIPVIASRSGAIPEVVDSAGLLFDEGNVEQLKDRIEQIFREPADERAYSKAGRQRVEAEFSNAVIGKKWADIFAQCLRL